MTLVRTLLVLGAFLVLAETKNYYVFKIQKVNWFAALHDCLTRDLQLATVNSLEEQRFLEKAMRNASVQDERLWISGNDLAQEGNFFWMSTGRPFVYTNWGSKEPSNSDGNENCVFVWGQNNQNTWNDAPCSFSTYFVCEDSVRPASGCSVDIQVS